MTRQAAKIDSVSVQWATDQGIHIGQETVRAALEFLNDPRRKERKEKAECKRCFYVHNARIGGATMTEQPCGICGVSQMYGSTATDKICKKCAIENELCKYCGADMELRPRRKYEKK